MISLIKSANLMGVNVNEVNVEVDISNGLPKFEIIGLPDASIKEASGRIRTAIKNSGYDFPIKRVMVNLSPAFMRKEGSKFDLAMAIGILKCMGYLELKDINNYVFIGELSLNGKVNFIKGVLPIVNQLKSDKKSKFIIPKENLNETLLIKDAEVYGVNSLKECLDVLKGKIVLRENKFNEEIFNKSYIGFEDVVGQLASKRALEIAASGMHNCMLIGPPGCGKTMLAKRVPTILPKLTTEESIEIMQIYSVVGKLENKIIDIPPFRNPHHTITRSALIGGGKIPMPGEISLAHNGVLFLDEFPEFKREVLESLRQPIEEKKIYLNRSNYGVLYPANFMLIASMNPCPCGYLGGSGKPCKCSEREIINYYKRLSGPLMDRIDLFTNMENITVDKLKNNLSETSEKIKKRVELAREIQLERFKNANIKFNSQMDEKQIKKYVNMSLEGKNTLEYAFKALNISMRGYKRMIKVARTIADMERSEEIKASHIEEVISYRNISDK